MSDPVKALEAATAAPAAIAALAAVAKNVPPAVVTAATTRVVPTVAMPIRIPVGHMGEQILSEMKGIVEAVAIGGVDFAFHAIPMGAFLELFIGHSTIKQFVDLGLTALGSAIDSLTIDLPGGVVYETIANLLENALPGFVAFFSDKIEPWILAELKTRGITV